MISQDGITVTTDEATGKMIQDAKLDAMEASLKDITEQNITRLKNAAELYKNTVSGLQQQLNDYKNILEHQQNIRKQYGGNEKLYSKVEEYIKLKEQASQFLNGEVPKNLYKAAFRFQEELNSVLGQEVEMIFVKEVEGQPEIYKIKTEDILRFSEAPNSLYGFSGRYNASMDAETLKRALEKVSLTDINFQFDINNLKNTRKEVLFRYQVGRLKKKKINKKTGKEEDKDTSASLILWQNPPHKWNALKVSNVGPIEETYAALILLNRSTPSFRGGTIDSYVADYMDYMYNSVTTESGLLTGDVTVGNVEYGIKTIDASTLHLAQIEKLANNILSTARFDQNALRKEKEKFSKNINKQTKSVKYSDLTDLEQKVYRSARSAIQKHLKEV